MAKKPLPTPDELRQLLRYEPETGKLFWLPRGPEWFHQGALTSEAMSKGWNDRWAHKEALTALSNGYKVGPIMCRVVPAHRAAWAIFHGEWPGGQIDHINGDRSDNRLENLRDIPGRENQKNMKRPSRNTSGTVGVDWFPARNKWRARIRHDGVNIHLGLFSSKEDAIATRKAAASEYGYHPNHGR